MCFCVLPMHDACVRKDHDAPTSKPSNIRRCPSRMTTNLLSTTIMLVCNVDTATTRRETTWFSNHLHRSLLKALLASPSPPTVVRPSYITAQSAWFIEWHGTWQCRRLHAESVNSTEPAWEGARRQPPHPYRALAVPEASCPCSSTLQPTNSRLFAPEVPHRGRHQLYDTRG